MLREISHKQNFLLSFESFVESTRAMLAQSSIRVQFPTKVKTSKNYVKMVKTGFDILVVSSGYDRGWCVLVVVEVILFVYFLSILHCKGG